MNVFSEYKSLFSKVDAATQIITANQRTARFLSAQWDAWHQFEGAAAWTSLPCQSLQLWQEQLWGQIVVSGLPEGELKSVLSAIQQRKIWSAIVTSQLEGSELLAMDSIVDAAMQSWQVLRQWGKSLEDLPEDQQAETELLMRCVQDYQQYCDEHKLMDAVDRTHAVERFLPSLKQLKGRRIVLVGFDSITPLDKKILDRLEGVGVTIEHFDLALNAQSQVCPLPDYRSEIQQAALWAADKILVRRRKGKEFPRIGIVIPDLANLREEVETLFTQVFRPQNILPESDRQAPVFNVSAGQPLAQTPIIATAFTALNALGKSTETDIVSSVFLSPFLWEEGSDKQRLRLMQLLVSDVAEITPLALDERLQKTFNVNHSPWIARWHNFVSRHEKVRGRRFSYGEWGELFTQMLTDLGWPGPRAIDTLEYQQLGHWPQLLEGLASLDAVAEEAVSWSDALTEFNRLAYTPFHPQTQSSPVQVLGLLEASGLLFDHLWVMGLDNRAWPEPCKPNPLLPAALQKLWHMPRASVERELELATRLTERLSTSACDVVFSYPQMEGDQPLQISPLIADFPQADDLTLPTYRPIDFYRSEVIELESLHDEKSRSLPSDHTVRGGTQILKNQALCPFKAFAGHRLAARRPDAFQPGVTALFRGQLLHKVLEMIWLDLRTQDALIKMPSAEFTLLIETCIDSAWRNLEASEAMGLSVQRIEKERAQTLLWRWFEIEKQRPAFEVVALEQPLQCEIAGLTMKARLDRRDRVLETESEVVIDYKTGQTDIRSWLGARPDEPQVPLYVLNEDNINVRAAAFAQINQHEIALKGVCAEGEPSGDLIAVEPLAKWDAPSSWPPLLAQWRSTLEALAEAFLRGDARVDPKTPNTCARCDYPNLCRVRESIQV